MVRDLTYQEQIKDTLKNFLSTKKSSGVHFNEALKALKNITVQIPLEGGKKPFAREVDWKKEIKVSVLASAIRKYYELTPLELAIELRQDFEYPPKDVINGVLSEFRDLSATKICGILLNKEVYPEFRDKPKETSTFLKNNGIVRYNKSDLETALVENFIELSNQKIKEIVDELFGWKWHPITYWQGNYEIVPESLSKYVQNLTVDKDGEVSINDVRLDYYYDYHALSFDNEIKISDECMILWGTWTFIDFEIKKELHGDITLRIRKPHFLLKNIEIRGVLVNRRR